MLKPLRCLALCLAPLTCLAPLAAQTLPVGVSAVRSVEGIDEFRLANGLQILLVPDDSKPTTTVNLTYRVGSRHENVGETGMAHLLEHMLFKGSPRHPKVWAEFTRRGLAADGTTSFDRTNYTASFSANDDNLRWYLGWLADSMIDSHIAREDLDTEMTVVRNEMESGENNPTRILLQRTMAAACDWHPYGRSIIGARSDVENVDIPRLQAFYRLYYEPDNATLIVSGSFEPQRVLQWVAASFGPIPKPTRQLPAMYTLDPAQDGERQVTLRRGGGAPLPMAAHHVPAGSQPDFAAVELLALVLGDTPAGRLHRQLTEKQLASSAFAFAWSLADPAVLVVGAQLAPGQDMDKARDALLAVGESIARSPITDEELQRVAEAYLRPANRTLGQYLPTDAPQRAPAPAKADLAATLQAFEPQAAAATVAAFDATPANIDARTQRFEAGGLKAAVLSKPTRGGAVQAVLSLRFGDGESLFGQAGAGVVSVALSSRREHLAEAVALVAELTRRPALPAEAFDECKRQSLTRIEAARKEPGAVAGNALARLVNPHPRGDVRHARSFDEQLHDLNMLTLEQVRTFHARFYSARLAQFGAAGDIDLPALQRALLAGFGGWNAGEPFTRVPQPLLPAKGETLLLATPNKQNADLRARLPMPLSDLDADYPAMMVANCLLGSGGSSRLWKRIRETEGLSYSVHSQIAWNHFEPNSSWIASAIFAPQNRARVETALREEITQALKNGFSAQELDAGRSGLLNFRRLSRAQDNVLASQLSANLYLGRSLAFAAKVDAALAALTLQQVNAALGEHIQPEAIDLVFAGDFKP
jgi:zinc protease